MVYRRLCDENSIFRNNLMGYKWKWQLVIDTNCELWEIKITRHEDLFVRARKLDKGLLFSILCNISLHQVKINLPPLEAIYWFEKLCLSQRKGIVVSWNNYFMTNATGYVVACLPLDILTFLLFRGQLASWIEDFNMSSICFSLFFYQADLVK